MEVIALRRSKAILMLILGLSHFGVSCRSSKSGGTHSEAAAASSNLQKSPSVPQVTNSPSEGKLSGSESIDLLALMPICDIDQNGLLIDLGVQPSPLPRGYAAGVLTSDGQNQTIDRAGSSFLKVLDRRLTRDFWLDEPTSELSVRVRMAGRSATAVSLSIDGRRLGRKKLTRNEVSVLSFPRVPERLEAGRHSVLLEAHGRASNPPEAWFEVDWVQLRRGESQEAADVAPTQRDIVADQELDGIPRRSVVLRAGTTVRCPFHFSGSSELKLDLGFWGSGRGVAEIRILEDGQPPKTLHERKIAGGNGARWTPVSVDLTSSTGKVVALELRAVSANQGGRVAFGEPKIIRSNPHPSAPLRAKTVVVVLAAGLERKLVPPWGPIADRAALVELRRDAVAFDGYRTPTTVPAGIVASLLTGMSPMAHRVEDTAARLRHDLRTVSQVIKQAGGRTAMFTGAPTTFAAFGFNVGWDDYASYSPVLDLPAETPIVEASRWLARKLDQSGNSDRFVLVHARGAHPPWDLGKEQVAQLEPVDYGGTLDARRGGITLGRLRRQSARHQRRLNEEDLVRLRGLMSVAFARQVSALGQLIETLKRKNAWDDTLLVFAGDTANGDPSTIPFDPVGTLRDEQLGVPLLVKFPRNFRGGDAYGEVVTTTDLTRTILDALGLKVHDSVEGVSLFDSIADVRSPQSRTQVATLGRRYVSRTGVWLLFGEQGSTPRLCQTDVDPMCVEDRFSMHPLTARSLWQWTNSELYRLRSGAANTQREPASIDPETAAALTVWGDLEM